MEDIETVNLCNSSLIASAVIQELQSNYAADSILIISKGWEVTSVSRILLAAMSPYMATYLKSVDTDSDECVIHVPDVDASCIQHVISSLLSSKNPDLWQVKELDGIFWSKNGLDCDENLKSNVYDVGTKFDEEELLHREIKLEDCFVESITDNIQVVKSEFRECNIMIPRLNLWTENGVLNLNKSPMKSRLLNGKRKIMEKSESSTKKSRLDEYIPSEDVDNCNVDKTFEITNLKSELLDDFQLAVTETAGPEVLDERTKRRKIRDENNEKRLKRKVTKTKKQEDRDSDYIPCTVSKPSSSKKKASRKKPRKKKVFVQREERDDEFNEVLDKIRLEIEDKSNLEDPHLVWCRHHQLDSDMHNLYNHEKQVQLVCPICRSFYDLQKSGKGFFNHMREYKYNSYVCSCTAVDKNETKMSHLQRVHWKWIKCNICNINFPASHIPVHRNTKHGLKEKIQCEVCGIQIKKAYNYFAHLDRHRVTLRTCDCKKLFRNRSHKHHHMQTVHLKQKLGCDRKNCYFLCDNQSEMDAHLVKKHGPKVKSDLPKVNAVCDICGANFNTKTPAASLREHKIRKHKIDSVMVDCPTCLKKFPRTYLNAHVQRVHCKRVCSFCGLEVKNLPRHLKHRHGERNFKCEHCPKDFITNQHLNQHMINVHLKTRPFRCRYGCGMDYNDPSNMYAHERRKHGGPFKAENTFKVEDSPSNNIS